MRNRNRIILWLLETGTRAATAALLVLSVGFGHAFAQEGDADASPPATAEKTALAFVELRVVPPQPKVDTLCRFRVFIANRSDRPISALRFAVSIDGEPLRAYDNQVFIETLAPGADTAVDLYNFWTSESERTATAGGSLEIQVRLESARFLERKIDDDGTEHIKLLGAVEGLPIEQTLTLAIAP